MALIHKTSQIPTLALFFLAAAGVLFTAQGAVQYATVALLGHDLAAPPQVFLVAAAFALTVLLSRQPPVFSSNRLLLLATLAVMGVGTLQPALDTGFAAQLKGPLQLLVSLMLFYLWVWAARHGIVLKVLFRTLMICSIVSAGIAVFEALTSHAMPWSKDLYVSLLSGDGAQGLEWFPVSFAYSILFPTGVAVGYLTSPANSHGHPGRGLCWLTLFAAFAGLGAAASRSGALAVVIALLLTSLMQGRLRLRSVVRLAAFVAPVLALSLAAVFKIVEKENPLDDIRLYGTYALYIPVIITNPLGVPGESIQDARLIIHAHEELGLNLPTEVFERAIEIAPHNGILTAGVRYGWAGVACLAVLYLGAIRRGKVALAAFRQTELEGLVRAAVCAIAAVLVHSWFHNASLLVGEMRNWAPVGLLAAAYAHALSVRASQLRESHGRANHGVLPQSVR